MDPEKFSREAGSGKPEGAGAGPEERSDRSPQQEQTPEALSPSLEHLREDLSSLIVQGLLAGEESESQRGEPEEEKRPEERPKQQETASPELDLAETGLIASLDSMVRDRALDTVEGLLRSETFRTRLSELIRQETARVLNSDMLKSKAGGASLIGERIRLECVRLFDRPAFRREMAKHLVKEVEKAVTPGVKRELSSAMRGALTEAMQQLADHLGRATEELHRQVQEIREEMRRELYERIAEVLGDSVPALAAAACEKFLEEQLEPSLRALGDRLRDVEEREQRAGFSPADSPAARGRPEKHVRAGRSPGAFRRIRERLEAEGKL